MVGWVSTWLTDIGRHASLLCPLLVDLSNIDPWSCKGIDVLPLLRQIWKHKGTKLKIHFTSKDDSAVNTADAKRLECAVAHLVIDTAMNLQSYSRYRQLLKSVRVSPGNNPGRMCFRYPRDIENFWGPPDQPSIYDVEFRISSAGVCRVANAATCLARLMCVQSISKEILAKVGLVKGTATFDLTRRLVSPNPSNLSQVNSYLRSLIRAYLSIKDVTANLRTAFFRDEMALLEKFDWDSNDLPFPSYLGPPSTVIMRFDLDNQTSLEDIRVDAVAVINVTQNYPKNTTILFELKHTKKSGSITDTFTLQLGDICGRVILALHEICEKDPAFDFMIHPVVWIDV